MKAIVLSLLCLFATLSVAQDGALYGRVVDANTRTGVKGARIVIDFSSNVVTDEEGKFELFNLKPKEYNLQIIADDYIGLNETIQIKDGEEKRIEFSMEGYHVNVPTLTIVEKKEIYLVLEN